MLVIVTTTVGAGPCIGCCLALRLCGMLLRHLLLALGSSLLCLLLTLHLHLCLCLHLALLLRLLGLLGLLHMLLLSLLRLLLLHLLCMLLCLGGLLLLLAHLVSMLLVLHCLLLLRLDSALLLCLCGLPLGLLLGLHLLGLLVLCLSLLCRLRLLHLLLLLLLLHLVRLLLSLRVLCSHLGGVYSLLLIHGAMHVGCGRHLRCVSLNCLWGRHGLARGLHILCRRKCRCCCWCRVWAVIESMACRHDGRSACRYAYASSNRSC